MDLLLKRRWLTDKATVGELWLDGVFQCFTCEDRYRPPPEPIVRKETCIPTGEYQVIINRSTRFGVDMPLVLRVPGFSGIRIHPGNTAADTEGCILVGKQRDVDAVKLSRLAFGDLFPKLQGALAKGERIMLIVQVDAAGIIC